MSDLNIEALEQGNNCEFFAEQRDYEAAMLRKFYTILYCIAIAVAASLVGLIIAISIKESQVAVATGVGTVVSGAAMKFILDRKADHQQRINKWVSAIKRNNCP